MDCVVTPDHAVTLLRSYTDNDGILRGEDKLGGHRHMARLTVAKAKDDMTAYESAIQYVLDSPASVFVVNVVKTGTRGRAKTPIPDRMFAAFYTKEAILRGVKERGIALAIHTNCVCFARVGIREMTQTFGLPICAIECPFALKDIPASPNPKRSATPYAAYWETFLSSTLHAHNVANLNNSRYDMRLVFVER